MVEYVKRCDVNGGDFWEVSGHYYSHPVQAWLKAEQIKINAESLKELEPAELDNLVEDVWLSLCNVDKMLFGGFDVDKNTVKKVVSYQLKSL